MITVIFRDCPPLYIEPDQTPVADQWVKLVDNHIRSGQPPIFRDPQRYTQDRLQALALKANRLLGWEWNCQDVSVANTTHMHKDIEQFLAQGYENIPEEYDELLHEIHFCLHSVESGSKRSSWLQIEWFTDDWFPLDADAYPAKLELEFGDVRLQNPYVGHHPLFLWQQNDHTRVLQTCRFHDRIKSGVCIAVQDKPVLYQFDWTTYLGWWQRHAQDFLRIHGQQNLIRYTGHPVVGRVRNLDDLRRCVERPYLILEHIAVG